MSKRGSLCSVSAGARVLMNTHSCKSGAKVANDLVKLNPELSGWVLHVLVFIVPRQMVDLGDPSRRSCDACESLGAAIKKIIKHLTCRRRCGTATTYSHRSQSGAKLWRQSFSKGYIQQAFERVSVRAGLLHGEENKRYLQRSDFRLLQKGKAGTSKFKAEDECAPVKIADAIVAPTVFSREAQLAVWS